MKILLTWAMAATLMFLMTGCKELNKLAELEEMAEMINQMNQARIADSLALDSIRSSQLKNDSVIYGKTTFSNDSSDNYTMRTTIKKVVLEGHEYWTVVGVGDNRGGVGITHSESCKCKIAN